MSNSLFSKDMQDQLKQLKTELSKGRGDSNSPDNNGKPTDNVILPSKQQIAKQVKKYDSEHLDDNKMLFMQAMSGVKPIKDQNLATAKKTVAKPDATTLAKRAAAQGGEQTSEVALSDMQALLNPVSGDAYLVYKAPTLQSKQFNMLKQGKIRWFDAVDLHGSSIDDARDGVVKLIAQARANNENCVKIVHGKGTDSIIKTCVNGWLRQMPEVLAFCSAPNDQGGNGAVLVLLKRQAEKA